MINKKKTIFILILLAAIFFIYRHTLEYDLIWDTKVFIRESILLNNNIPLYSAFKYGYIYGQLGMQKQSFYYRPVVNLSFMLEKRLWGLKSGTLRLTNIIIFLLTIIFLFLFLNKQGEDYRFPFIAAILFALSSLNIENIVWIVGRCDLFLILWGILTLFLLELFIEKKKNIYIIGSILFYTLGMFSKETFLFFWPILLVYEFVKKKRISWFYHAANLLVTIVFFVVKNVIIGISNIHFVIVPNIFDYLKTATAVFGYYSRILLFPFYFDNFNFVNKVTTPIYFILGIFSILFIFFIFYLTRKDRKNWFPIALIVFSILPYIVLAFTTLWPFRISSRYMMVPFLGVAWILTRFICRLKIRLQNIVVISLVIMFIPAIISGTYRYRNEKSFWEDALGSHPDNSFVLLKMANMYYEEADDLESHFYLNKALTHSMAKTTAIEISIMLAKLAYQRKDYKKALEWLKRINFKTLPYQKFHINKLKALILISQGEASIAERILKENIDQYKQRKENYFILYDMYIGYTCWTEARNLEQLMKKRFSTPLKMNTDKIENEFNRISLDKKIDFYVKYKNYKKAIETIKMLDLSDLKYELFLVELYYKNGNPIEAQKIIKQLIKKHPGNHQLKNTIGLFYLNKVKMVNKALFYFKESLKINRNQPGINELVDFWSKKYRKISRNGL